MDASQVSVRERLAQIGLSDEEEKAIIVKLVEGTVSPSNWNIINNLDLAASIRVLIQPGISYSYFIVPHSKFCIINICFSNYQYLVILNSHHDLYHVFIF
jgi:hypothetical protein